MIQTEPGLLPEALDRIRPSSWTRMSVACYAPSDLSAASIQTLPSEIHETHVLKRIVRD